MLSVYKGIFWYIPNEHSFLCVKVACDITGNTVENVEFSSKSAGNFNHKIEWEKLQKSNKIKNPYNYYPRGRVEIKNGKATVYLNPVLNNPSVCNLIFKEFGLNNSDIVIRTISDGSRHYDYLIDF